jgi:SAM-dependent methyltransferase
MKEHWERVYDKKPVKELGWYESSPEPSLSLIELCSLKKNAVILNVGAGATTLVDELLDLGYQNTIANDISESALQELQLRLGPERSALVRWSVDDLTNPSELLELGQIDLWHDRAVLHFFQKEADQEMYFSLLRKLVAAGGHVIIAAFNLNGAPKCSGLPVFRYDARMLQIRLGEEFQLKKAFDFTYTQPSGDSREYVYTLFQRITK